MYDAVDQTMCGSNWDKLKQTHERFEGAAFALDVRSEECCEAAILVIDRKLWAGHVDHSEVVALPLQLAPFRFLVVWHSAIESPHFLTGAKTQHEVRLRLRMSLSR